MKLFIARKGTEGILLHKAPGKDEWVRKAHKATHDIVEEDVIDQVRLYNAAQQGQVLLLDNTLRGFVQLGFIVFCARGKRSDQDYYFAVHPKDVELLA